MKYLIVALLLIVTTGPLAACKAVTAGVIGAGVGAAVERDRRQDEDKERERNRN